MNDRQSSKRLLAPAALAVFGLIFIVIVVTSLAGGGRGGSTKTKEAPKHRVKSNQPINTATTGTGTTSQSLIYVVKEGDTLGSISEQTGVAVDQLEALNPDVDPQALIAGQKLKLR